MWTACSTYSFVRALVAPYYAAGGRPSIDPVVFFKLQLVMFFEGIRSERQFLRLVADRLGARWYIGYDLDEALPDHSSLTRIRERYGLEVFRRFFDAIVERCQEAGLVWGAEAYIDATKMVANAAVESVQPRFAVAARAIWTTCSRIDEEASGPQPAEPVGAEPPRIGPRRGGGARPGRDQRWPARLGGPGRAAGPRAGPTATTCARPTSR